MNVYETKKIRNIALLGHGGCGKTTLTEAMLYTAGGKSRFGRVENGNTSSDFDQEEIKRKISIRTSLIPVEWKNHKINVLDTPGYFDFVGNVKEAVSACDAAIIVMKASSGIEVGTEKAWEICEEAKLPRMLYITEMDAPNVDIEAILDDCKAKFGSSIAPMQVPWYDGEKYIGYIHAVKMVARRFEGDKVIECDIPEGYEEKLEHVRTMILEAVAETDEDLMEKYFAEEEITVEEIEKALKVGVAAGDIVPVLCGNSVDRAGIRTLMDNIIRCFPSPDEAVEPCDMENKTGLFIFKTMVDPFIGKFSLFKVRSGEVNRDDSLLNVRTGEVEKLSHIYVLQGKEQMEVEKLYAGDIGAVSKLRNTNTCDTLRDKDANIEYEPIDFDKPYVQMAIFPLGKGDEEKMSLALTKLMAEDKTFYTEYDKETHETVIYGIGEQQLDVVVNMLQDKFKVGVRLAPPTTRYRETIKGKMQVRGKHKKQSGGHGQYGDVVMEFEPSGDLDMPYVFEEKIFGGSVPKQYFPAVEKGLEECIHRGVLAGYPVVGLKAVLLDGSYHPVDSSEMAFKMATTIAFKEGVVKAKPTILEPIAHVEISVPDEYTGDIMGDMKKRRGRLIGMELQQRKQLIIAEVPMSEIYRYATDLRSMTQGRGTVEYYFERYEEAPSDVQQKVIDARKELA
ncbi:elongation factor G [Zhenhengia yiwuensis]|uniref:Elongation factor G n=1 Tax=Zhenhengia yiwuensis TaxID=2763666 RepID=A0A926ELM2_9FIRM|nr:elongation factor G [Zhenhengia yiwuensis]MBC8580587.1 elongation factor G [Zhenhengia yiwuensis]